MSQKLQIIHASLQSLPVLVSVSSTVKLRTIASKKVNAAKALGETTPLDARANKITRLLARIRGYDHGGLNE